jgi:IS5 family transposase
VLAERAKAKVSSAYASTDWDLVDATEAGAVDLTTLSNDALPASMSTMSDAQKRGFVEDNRQRRQAIKAEIKHLSEVRERYLAKEAEASASIDKPTMGDALTQSVREQAQKKAFKF